MHNHALTGKMLNAFRTVVVFIPIVLVAGNNADVRNQQNNGMSSEIRQGDAAAAAFEDGAVQTVIGFLKWYRTQYSTLKQIRLVNRKGAGESRSEHYSVNFKGTEEYLSKLRGSGYISDEYIDKQRRIFRKREEHFRRYPQTDGPAEGFEHDLVLRTQEIDEALAKIDHVKVTEVKKSSTSSIVDADTGMNLRFRLSKNSGKWLIDIIESNGIE